MAPLGTDITFLIKESILAFGLTSFFGKKFIYISTVHVYGSPLQGKIDEQLIPRPSHPYSITHRVAEDFVLEADQRGKLNGIILRLSNAVGSPLNKEGMSWKLVVNDLCKQVVKKRQMELFSDETIQRDFLPISGVCSVVNRAISYNNFDGEIFNLSSGNALTLRDLTSLIADRSEVTLGFKPSTIFNTSIINKRRIQWIDKY